MYKRVKPGNGALPFVKRSQSRLLRGGGGINRNKYSRMIPYHLDDLLIEGPSITGTEGEPEALPKAVPVVGLNTHIDASEKEPVASEKEPDYSKLPDLEGTVSKELENKVYKEVLQPADTLGIKQIEAQKESETSSKDVSSALKDKYINPDKTLKPDGQVDESLTGKGDGCSATKLPHLLPRAKKRPSFSFTELVKRSKAAKERKKRKIDTLIEKMQIE